MQKNKNNIINCRFQLEQRKLYNSTMKLNHRSDNNFSNSYLPIMTKIANLFDVTLY